MEFFNNLRARARCRADRSQVEPRGDFNYDVDYYDFIDSLIWTAVHYIDCRMRPYMEKDPMFTKFCVMVESFEALFKAHTSYVPYNRPSKGIPRYIRHYLHQQMESDLDWLDTEFRKSEGRSLYTSLLMKNLNPSSFGAGALLSLVIHLLQWIPVYGPTDGPDDGFYSGGTEQSPRNHGRAEYRSSELVMQSIGNKPSFVWVERESSQGREVDCYLAVSHKFTGSMDFCWLNLDHERGNVPNVKIDPVFRGKNYRGTTEDDGLDSDGQVIEEYDAPEKCLCAFHNEMAASAILDPSKAKDPTTHEGCLMIKKICTSIPIAHSEMYELQASRTARDAKNWKALCQNYSAKSPRPSVLSRIWLGSSEG